MTEHTNEEVHLRFEAAVAQLGQSVDAREGQMHALLIDGVRFGDRLAELRRPGTMFYSQSYVEARSAAMLVVDLGMADCVRDLRRLKPPAPDIEVVLNNGASIFLEQTMVMDEDAHRLSVAVDRANALVRESTDVAVGAALKAGLVTIRLDRLAPAYHSLTVSADELADEVSNLVKTFHGGERLIDPGPAYPLLHQLGARAFYHLGLETASPLQPPMDHGRATVFESTIRERVRSKLEKAKGYSSQSHPLWLILDVDYHFGLVAFDAVAQSVLASERMTPFDRVVVQQARRPPLVIDP